MVQLPKRRRYAHRPGRQRRRRHRQDHAVPDDHYGPFLGLVPRPVAQLDRLETRSPGLLRFNHHTGYGADFYDHAARCRDDAARSAGSDDADQSVGCDHARRSGRSDDTGRCSDSHDACWSWIDDDDDSVPRVGNHQDGRRFEDYAARSTGGGHDSRKGRHQHVDCFSVAFGTEPAGNDPARSAHRDHSE